MEIWKPIAGFDGYEVSSLGRVRSLKRSKPVILPTRQTYRIYPSVWLFVDGNRKLCTVHRLVAQVFIPNPDNKPQVNHINGDKTDNRVENLEWCTPSENIRHAVANGLILQGEDNCNTKLTNDQARFIRDNPENLTGVKLAEMFGVSKPTISLIQRGKGYLNAGGTIRQSKKPRVADNIRAEIRRLYVHGSHEFGCYGLAKKFGIDDRTVRRIIRES